MPEVMFEDAQQAAGFVTPALYRTYGRVFETKYPSFDYAGLVPVNTDGDMWDIGTLVYSGDIAGSAAYLGGKAFDVPNASVNFSLGTSQFFLAGVGYELGLQEVNRASRMNLSLGDRKAAAARMVAEKFVYDRVISGSTEKSVTGLVNNAVGSDRQRHQRLVGIGDGPRTSWPTSIRCSATSSPTAARRRCRTRCCCRRAAS
jgi:hypothetical protein